MTSHSSPFTTLNDINSFTDVGADACIIETDRFGGGSVMLWSGIAYGLKTLLIVVNGNLNAIQYRDRILRQCMVPFVQQHNLTFQQDNSRPHVI